jgi:hypothetical protein
MPIKGESRSERNAANAAHREWRTVHVRKMNLREGWSHLQFKEKVLLIPADPVRLADLYEPQQLLLFVFRFKPSLSRGRSHKLSLFIFTPAEAAFLAAVIRRTSSDGFQRTNVEKRILHNIELRLLFPKDLRNFSLNPKERICLVQALQAFTLLADAEEYHQQAINLSSRLARRKT